jgi:hypothetical protein
MAIWIKDPNQFQFTLRVEVVAVIAPGFDDYDALVDSH